MKCFLCIVVNYTIKCNNKKEKVHNILEKTIAHASGGMKAQNYNNTGGGRSSTVNNETERKGNLAFLFGERRDICAKEIE